MAKIVLISCVSKKLDRKAKCEELYVNSLFKKILRYAKMINPDRIFILSAKHGLLDLEQEIEPYNETLNKMSRDKIKAWAEFTLKQIRQRCNLEHDEFIFFAGIKYRKFLIPHIKNYQIPMEGLKIGKQHKWLNERIKDYEQQL